MPDFSDFVRERYYEELLEASRKESALVIDFSQLDMHDPVLADKLLEEPAHTLAVMEEVVNSFDLPGERVAVRFRNLPERRSVRIRDLRSKHLNHLWMIDGVIKSASEVKPQVDRIIFKCPDCGKKIEIEQEGSLIIQKPYMCECGRRGDFEEVEKKLIDTRWLSASEPFELTEGEQPGQISVFLKEDLTTPKMQKKSDPGSRLKVVGIVKDLPKRIKGRLTTKMDMFVDTLYFETADIEFEDLEITEEDEQRIRELSRDPEIYEKLKKSIAPGIYGFDEIKESLVLQIFGGVPHRLPDGSRIRGNIHVLLTGDPGTGKSVLLSLISKIIPRGKYVSGSGVTGAGLCTTYDSLIFLKDGTMAKIGDLVENKIGNIKIMEGQEHITADGDGMEVMSLDQKAMKIMPMKVTKYWKLRSPEKLVKITTRLGREVRVTEKNPIPVISDGNIVWKKACDIREDDFIATPRIISAENNSTSLIEAIDDTSRLANCRDTVSNILVKAKEKYTIRDFSRKCGISEHSLYYSWPNENRAPKLSDIRNMCSNISLDFEEVLPETMILEQQLGHRITVPKNINEDLMYFFGLIAGDGNISRSKYGGYSLRFHSADRELLDKFGDICRNLFSTEPEYYKHPERIAYYRINSKILGIIAEKFGIPSGKKSHRLRITERISSLPDSMIASYIRGVFDTDGFVSERKTKGSDYAGFTTASKEFSMGMQMLLMRFGIISKIREKKPSLSMIKGKIVKSRKKYELEIFGLENLRRFDKHVSFGLVVKREKLKRVIGKLGNDNTNIDVVPNIFNLLRDARHSVRMTSKEIFGYKNYSYEKERRFVSRNKLSYIVKKLSDKNQGKENEEIRKLRILSESDIFWDKVKYVERVSGEEFVYDLTVEGGHSFVTNGIVIHNTASVRKDEVLGSWVLEAGALILANRGLISIDEFDKMSKDDQIAMHEAMSIETISIAKASIVATLPAQTAVLAGANPKLGRFDPYIPIIDQIQIPETLLSRFDLKFALRDIPSRETDRSVAEHIIKSRTEPERVEPLIDLSLLRKYIAYAKQIQHMELTKDAADSMLEFYVEMRNRYTGEDTSIVPITLRQYEALIRLAEASAKVRLGNKILKEDADRSIRLVQFSLMQLGVDMETGRIDIDKLESGVTASKRKKIVTLMEIISSLQKPGGEVSLEDVRAEAENMGIQNIEDVIDRLKREGTIFEPRPGYIKKV